MTCLTCLSNSGAKRISPGPTIYAGAYWYVEHAYPTTLLYGTGSSVPDDLANWRILAEDFVASSAGRHVYPGIAGYYDDFDAIAQRIAIARELGAPGHVLFSYATLDSRGYWDDLAAGPYRVPAVVPSHLH